MAGAVRSKKWLEVLTLGSGLLLIAFLVLAATRSNRSSNHTLPPAPEPPRARQIAANHWVVPATLKMQYMSDAVQVSRAVTLKPEPEGTSEKVSHLRIMKLDQESPLFAAGLRKDDQILKVNGTSIGTLGRAMNLVHEVRETPRLVVQVQRGAERIEYKFDFE